MAPKTNKPKRIPTIKWDHLLAHSGTLLNTIRNKKKSSEEKQIEELTAFLEALYTVPMNELLRNVGGRLKRAKKENQEACTLLMYACMECHFPIINMMVFSSTTIHNFKTKANKALYDNTFSNEKIDLTVTNPKGENAFMLFLQQCGSEYARTQKEQYIGSLKNFLEFTNRNNERCFNINHISNDRKTALDFAMENLPEAENSEIVKLLRKAGAKRGSEIQASTTHEAAPASAAAMEGAAAAPVSAAAMAVAGAKSPEVSGISPTLNPLQMVSPAMGLAAPAAAAAASSSAPLSVPPPYETVRLRSNVPLGPKTHAMTTNKPAAAAAAMAYAVPDDSSLSLPAFPSATITAALAGTDYFSPLPLPPLPPLPPAQLSQVNSTSSLDDVNIPAAAAASSSGSTNKPVKFDPELESLEQELAEYAKKLSSKNDNIAAAEKALAAANQKHLDTQNALKAAQDKEKQAAKRVKGKLRDDLEAMTRKLKEAEDKERQTIENTKKLEEEAAKTQDFAAEAQLRFERLEAKYSQLTSERAAAATEQPVMGTQPDVSPQPGRGKKRKEPEESTNKAATMAAAAALPTSPESSLNFFATVAAASPLMAASADDAPAAAAADSGANAGTSATTGLKSNANPVNGSKKQKKRN